MPASVSPPQIQLGSQAAPLVIGRYAIYDPIAAGGMATVHLGRSFGEAGFSRTVAIKRLHPHLARMPEFAASFVDEARIAARIRHPNVVPTIDVVSQNGELFLVMEYIEGATLSVMMRHARERNVRLPVAVACGILANALHGLHAAHEARGDQGQPLDIVHRDISPQNILVGLDGVPRVLDFGIAKAMGQLHLTEQGHVKGKLAYMAPEQALGGSVTRLTDLFAAGIVLWEALTNMRLFEADSEAAVLHKLREHPIAPPSTIHPEATSALDEVVLKALSRNPADRFQSAEEFAIAIERAVALASPHTIGGWVKQLAGEPLSARAQRVAELESVSSLQIITGTGTASPLVAGPPNESPRSELWKVAILALGLAVLLPAAWWLTHRAAPQPPPAVAMPPPPPTMTQTSAPPEPTALASPLVTAPVTPMAVEAPPTSTASMKKIAPVPKASSGGKLYSRE